MRLTIKKLFHPSNYFYNFLKLTKLHNVILNKRVDSASFDEISSLKNIECNYFNINPAEYEIWVNNLFSELPKGLKDIHFKKLVEFYTSYMYLQPETSDIFMDTGGGIFTYIHKLPCQKKYLQDLRVTEELKSKFGNEIEYIECDAKKISLPDKSVDKISVHHSFEHFQEESDTFFIKEVQRLLRPGGRCCIVPLFIANEYSEVTSSFRMKKVFDKKSKHIIDITAILPGGSSSGDYARLYDIYSLQERIISQIDFNSYKVIIVEIKMDSHPVPDLSLKCHFDTAHIEQPYRAFIIERIS